MKKLWRDKRGAMHLFTLFLLIGLLGVGSIVIEVLRVHGIQENLNDELYRAANLAIKTAMYDSYRIDHISRFDDELAVDAFDHYLMNDLGLNGNYEKVIDHEVQYRLVINEISVNGKNVRMHVEATAYAAPLFRLWGSEWEIPLNITSRNMRVD